MQKLAFALFLLISANANAAICTSLSNGNWSTAGRWSCGRVPLTTDTVVIAHNVTMMNNYVVAGLTINAGAMLIDNGFNIDVTGNVVINGTFGDPVNLFGGTLTMLGANSTLSGTGFLPDTTIQINAANVNLLAGSNLSFGSGAMIDVGPNVAGSSITINGTITANGQVAGDNIIQVNSGSSATVGNGGVINAPLSRINLRTNSVFTNNGTITIADIRGRTGAPAPIFTQGNNATLNINSSVCTATRPCTLNASAAGNTVNYAAGVVPAKTTYWNIGGAGIGCPLPVGVTSLGANPCTPAIDHIEMSFNGSALTCQPITVTIKSCANAACTTLATSGTTGTLSAVGATANFVNGANYTIPAGQSQTTSQVWITQPGVTTLSATGGVNPSSCVFNGAASCALTSADSGFLVNTVNHVSATQSTVTVQAVQKTNNAPVCTPSYTGIKTLNASCSYVLPTTGTQLLTLDATAMNCAGGMTYPFAKTFDATGSTSFTLSYPDVGHLNLALALTGAGTSAGLAMSGSSSFVVAPSAFSVIAPATPIISGQNFTVQVKSINALGAITPNFGLEGESVLNSMLVDVPIGGVNPALNILPITFTSGIANIVENWGEVGRGRIRTSLVSGNYLGSGINVPFIDSPVTFIPHHFRTAVVDGCAACGYTYSGQGIKATITAENLANAKTSNYTGGIACNTNLSAIDTVGIPSINGALTASSVLASNWINGIASALPIFTFTSPSLFAPQSVTIRANEVGCNGISSAGSPLQEGSSFIRQGRVIVRNGLGSELIPLSQDIQIQTWTGSLWTLANTDSVTPITGFTMTGWNKLIPGSTIATSKYAAFIGGLNGVNLSAPKTIGSVNVGAIVPLYLLNQSGLSGIM